MVILFVLISHLSFADSLYEHGYFEEARVEYLRTFFFYPELRQNVETRMRYAISVLNRDQSKGISELHKLINEFPDLPSSLRVEIAKQFIKTQRYYLAVDLLSTTEEKKLLGLVYLLDGQLSDARTNFAESGDHEIVSLIDKHLQHPKKSERTAALLSLFVPGAGDIYAGNPGLGIRDFILNLGSGYLFYNALRQHKYVDATLVFVFLVNRFYLGSLHNAVESAIRFNEKRHQEWLEHIIDTYFPAVDTQIR